MTLYLVCLLIINYNGFYPDIFYLYINLCKNLNLDFKIQTKNTLPTPHNMYNRNLKKIHLFKENFEKIIKKSPKNRGIILANVQWFFICKFNLISNSRFPIMRVMVSRNTYNV